MRDKDEQLRAELVEKLTQNIASIELQALESPAATSEMLFGLGKKFRSLRKQTIETFKWIEGFPN